MIPTHYPPYSHVRPPLYPEYSRRKKNKSTVAKNKRLTNEILLDKVKEMGIVCIIANYKIQLDNNDYIKKYERKYYKYLYAVSEQQYQEYFIETSWDDMVKYEQHSLCEDFLRFHHEKVNWELVMIHQQLSEKFIEEFEHKKKDHRNLWDYISRYQNLSEKFIMKHEDKIAWDELIKRRQNFSEDFYKENFHRFRNKGDFLRHQKLSDNFIKKNFTGSIWSQISTDTHLSQENMIKYSDKVDWTKIERYNKHMKDHTFVKKYKDKINWNRYTQFWFKKLNEEGIEELKYYFDWDFITWKYTRRWNNETFINQYGDFLKWDVIEYKNKTLYNRYKNNSNFNTT